MLRTWEFGTIEIVDAKEITSFDTWIRDDSLGEWSYYQIAEGYVVAVHNWEE